MRGTDSVDTSAGPRIWVFFYGSYMNLEVLKEVELIPGQIEVARLSGFDIAIRPLANLVRSDQHSVYGILATATHAELARLYAHAHDVLGGTYLPEAVLTQTRAGAWQPALCYIAPAMAPAPAANDYVDRIVEPAREHGFPDWYVARLNGFRR
jgi:cation transport regulator ChaC